MCGVQKMLSLGLTKKVAISHVWNCFVRNCRMLKAYISLLKESFFDKVKCATIVVLLILSRYSAHTQRNYIEETPKIYRVADTDMLECGIDIIPTHISRYCN